MSAHHLTPEYRRARLAARIAGKWKCSVCGRSRRHGARLEVHHKKPVKDGGSDDPANLEVRCADCHLAAHDTNTPERRAWLDRLRLA